MKVIRLILLLTATALCGLWFVRPVRPVGPAPPGSRSLNGLIEELRFSPDRKSAHTPVKRTRAGHLLYFYEGEWRGTPPPPQDLPLLIKRPVEQAPVRGLTPFRLR